MDFFSHQEKARHYTKVLVGYFLIAVTLIVVAVNFIIYYFFIFLEFYPYTPETWFSDGVIYYVSAGTVLLIVSGSLFRWQQLKSGGHKVAEMLGGRLLDLHTSDVKRRQLINVIEEMSIASGVPLPAIYVLENEPGINAFVAGYQPTEAAMVVTQGAIESLGRDELQGVVAHEYSHILNGDMQINIKLMAILAGILMISVSGRILMRGSYSRGHMSNRSVVSGNRSGSALVILGLLLIAVGYIGVLCGRVIKAAVSRQREFLADAAAVQFTRNPEGIASALYKIGEATGGSKIKDAHVEAMSHMCFSEAISTRFNQWMATHPSLDKRISRIYPGFLSRMKARRMTENIQAAAKSNHQAGVDDTASLFASAQPVAALSATQVAQTVGQIDQAHIDYASSVHQSFSEELKNAVHLPESAKAVAFAMILAKMDFQANKNKILNCIGTESIKRVNQLKDSVFTLKNAQRLPLFDMLLPTLKQMEEDEKSAFILQCRKLVQCDKKYTLFEFVLLSLLEQHLSPEPAKEIKVKYFSYKSLSEQLQLIFSVMAHSTGAKSAVRGQVFQKVTQSFAIKDNQPLALKAVSARKIQRALNDLSRLSPLLKRNVIEACADIAMDDGRIKSGEAELLRAISVFLDCPMPPLLPQAE